MPLLWLLLAVFGLRAEACTEYRLLRIATQPEAKVRVLAESSARLKDIVGGKYFSDSPRLFAPGSTGGVFYAVVVGKDGVRREVLEKRISISPESAGKSEAATAAFEWAAEAGIGPKVLGHVDLAVKKEVPGTAYETTERLIYLENLSTPGETVLFAGPFTGLGLRRVFSLPESAQKEVMARYARLRAVHPDSDTLDNFHVAYLKNPPDSPQIVKYRGEDGLKYGVDLRGVDWAVSSNAELEQMKKDWEASGSPNRGP